MAPIKNLMYRNKKLIVFDIEGIIIPKNRYLIFEISRKVGFIGFILDHGTPRSPGPDGKGAGAETGEPGIVVVLRRPSQQGQEIQ